ncbi:MAG: PfkB family carbohydrate kinase [Mariniphaga sp.]
MRIFTIGETTFDIMFRNGLPIGSCSGGSAYNSAISLGRCGLPVSLVSTFGNDYVGDLSMAFLMSNGVDCGFIKRFDGQSRVALAFMNPDNNGDYSFYPASKDVVPEYPEPHKNDIVLLGSSFAIRDNGRENLLDFLKKAKVAGGIIIYDPNARQRITDNPGLLSKTIENFELASIIKGSDQDFRNIFGLDSGQEVFTRISEFGPKCLVYTKGAMGSELLVQNIHLKKHAPRIKVESTIGAGDNFSAGIVSELFKYLNEGNLYSSFELKKWREILNSGTWFATQVCGSAENYLPIESANHLMLKT